MILVSDQECNLVRFKKNKKLTNPRRFLVEGMVDANGMELQVGDDVIYDGEVYELYDESPDENGMVEIQRNTRDSREITRAPLSHLELA